MEKLAMCRICLVVNVRMYVVVNKNLHELYEKLTDVPFLTEDSRPMLACFFCCTKLKQCWRFLRICLEAEELFAQMSNEDYQPDPLINPGRSEFFKGFSYSPLELIRIGDGGQTERNAIKEELPDVSERLNNIFDPEEKHQTHIAQGSSCPLGPADGEHWMARRLIRTRPESATRCNPSAPQRDVSTEDGARYGKCLLGLRNLFERESELDNVENSYPHVKDTPSHYAEPNSKDVPSMKIKTEVEDEQESVGVLVATKLKQDTRRPNSRETISAEHNKNENKPNMSYVSKIVQNHSSKQTTFIESFTNTQHNVNTTVNDTALGTSSRNNTNKDDLECKMSNKRGNNDNRNRYRRTLVTEKRFKCDICHQRSFSKMSDLIRHTRTHTGEKPFKCDVCQRSFTLKYHLTIHTRIHTGEKPFKCEICQCSFRHKNYLTSHTRTHTGEKPFKCDICNSSFSQKIHLTTHIRTHTGEKPFKCEICQRNFSKKGDLVSHTRIHTGEKRFKCDICQRSFTKKCDLVSHTRTHTGDNPFKCIICQSSFHTKHNLIRHIQTHSGEDKPFICG